jgi:hypothetical protein
MSRKWVDFLFLQEMAVATVLLATVIGVVGGWIALLKQFGLL